MWIGIYFFVKSDDWDKAEFIYIPLLTLSFFLIVFNYRKSTKARAANLSEYAKQNELIFAEEPEQEQIDEFRAFKAVKGIAGYRNSDFSNILVPQGYRTSNKGIKPKIANLKNAFPQFSCIDGIFYCTVFRITQIEICVVHHCCHELIGDVDRIVDVQRLTLYVACRNANV